MSSLYTYTTHIKLLTRTTKIHWLSDNRKLLRNSSPKKKKKSIRISALFILFFIYFDNAPCAQVSTAEDLRLFTQTERTACWVEGGAPRRYFTALMLPWHSYTTYLDQNMPLYTVWTYENSYWWVVKTINAINKNACALYFLQVKQKDTNMETWMPI